MTRHREPCARVAMVALLALVAIGCGGRSRAAEPARTMTTAPPMHTQTATTQPPPPQERPAAEQAPVLYEDDPDEEVRHALDRRADDILACTRGAVTAVDLSWAIDGSLQVELTGSLMGTPAEECVRQALVGLPIPSGEAGRIRHPVRQR